MKTAVHRIPGLVLTGHTFEVPLDHTRPGGSKIEVYAREVVAPGKEGEDLPWLVFFQGGPGFPSPRPTANSGWLKRALQDYRVLLLDQRGTGRSTPATFRTLAHFSTPKAAADYLTHFRADAIVQDAEWIRRELLGEQARWSVLGQSFGGFCAVHYLSAAPSSLKEVLITGGLPPLNRTPDEVYRATYRRVLERNGDYFERYPEDQAVSQEIVRYLIEHEVYLPGGDLLSPRRFQQLGMGFGASDGFEQVHYLLEAAFVQGKSERELSYPFLRGVENIHSFDTNPIYALLHEPIYCQADASRWSAHRVLAEYREFEISPDGAVTFTGEMVYPWMFEESTALRPLKEAADILADWESWPRLYDADVLGQNQVPCAAAVYYNDMYVERAFSLETAAAIQGLKPWITNEYDHNALRAEGEVVLDRLLKLVRGG